MQQSKFPTGWDEQRVSSVLKHYDRQTDDEAVAEDEAPDQTLMQVPNELVPEVRELIAKLKAA